MQRPLAEFGPASAWAPYTPRTGTLSVCPLPPPFAGVDVPSDSGRLSLSVHDPDRLTVALGLRPPPQWIEEHEIRLRRMREVYGQS
ncbi:hypothetical protein ACIGCZ_20385 [Streptomyces nigra]|uniref:hypothetical protein n=1 Tax=Streptomyces nigra TaxID=1827580 RepID=UPI0037D4A1F4